MASDGMTKKDWACWILTRTLDVHGPEVLGEDSYPCGLKIKPGELTSAETLTAGEVREVRARDALFAADRIMAAIARAESKIAEESYQRQIDAHAKKVSECVDLALVAGDLFPREYTGPTDGGNERIIKLTAAWTEFLTRLHPLAFTDGHLSEYFAHVYALACSNDLSKEAREKMEALEDRCARALGTMREIARILLVDGRDLREDEIYEIHDRSSPKKSAKGAT